MRNAVLGLVAVASLLVGAEAHARPLVATYTGVVLDTNDPFTAAFHYNTADLAPSPGNSDFLDAKPGTLQWATYSDPTHSITFSDPLSFSKGEYDSTVYDSDGEVSEIDTIHEYSIMVRSGRLSLRFGGAGDSGIVEFNAEGTDYVQLDPRSFLLTKDVLSAVPLPAGAPMFGGALALLGIVGAVRMRRHHPRL